MKTTAVVVEGGELIMFATFGKHGKCNMNGKRDGQNSDEMIC